MNRAIRINVVTFGVMLAQSGMLAHGLSEVLQGNTPTGGLFIVAFVISVTGFVPGMSDADQILHIDLFVLGVGYLLYLLAFVAGFAHDIERQPDSHENLEKEKEQT